MIARPVGDGGGMAPAPEPDDAVFQRGFGQVFRFMQDYCMKRAGIHVPDGKQDLVRARLSKRVRALRLSGFTAYLDVLRDSPPKGEARIALEALTTNLTYFFREERHFQVLREALPAWCRGPSRVWSAGCSSGEEPYTIAMTAVESSQMAGVSPPKILATDLDTGMVERTRAGRYATERLKGISPEQLRRFFRRDRVTGEAVVEPETRSLVSAARLNLMGPWPMKSRFHAIFCRNVMIYFTNPTRESLVRRYHEVLEPNGLLFVGMSESLNSLDVPFEYVEPGVYRPV